MVTKLLINNIPVKISKNLKLIKLANRRADFQKIKYLTINMLNTRMNVLNTQNAHLINAHLINAHLINAHLINAHLINAHLINAHLIKVHFFIENFQIDINQYNQ